VIVAVAIKLFLKASLSMSIKKSSTAMKHNHVYQNNILC